MDAMFAIAQAIGFVAMGTAIYSFQARRRITMLSLQTVSNLLWMTHYLMLGSTSAVFANLIGTVRNVIYGFRGKYKFADSKLVPAISIIVFLISGVMTYSGPFDILPTFAMVFASIAFFIKDEKMIRYISVFIALPWLTFGIYAGSIASIVSDGSTLLSILIAIFRYRKFEIYESTTMLYFNDKRTDEEYESDIEEKLSEDAIENSI
jgi:hypothetical protein